MANIKRGYTYATAKYQQVGKKIRKAVGDFRPGTATGPYRTMSVRETVQSAPQTLKALQDAFKAGRKKK